MYYEQQNLPKWQVLNDLAVNKNKIILSNNLKPNEEAQVKGNFILEEQSRFNEFSIRSKPKILEKGQVNKSERLNNLKLVLKETMNLTKTLKSQVAILKKKGINDTIQAPQVPK